MIKLYEKLLLTLAKKGDRKSFGKLYDLYFPKIYNFIIHRVGNKETAEDLSMETFRRALMNLEKISTDLGCFSGWLYRVANNLVSDYFRQKKYFVEDFDISRIEIASEIDWEELEKDKRDALIRAAVSGLSPKEQLIITLRFFEGLKPARTAEIVDCTVEQLYVNQFRALNKLKKSLETQGMVSPIYLEEKK